MQRVGLLAGSAVSDSQRSRNPGLHGETLQSIEGIDEVSRLGWVFAGPRWWLWVLGGLWQARGPVVGASAQTDDWVNMQVMKCQMPDGGIGRVYLGFLEWRVERWLGCRWEEEEEEMAEERCGAERA